MKISNVIGVLLAVLLFVSCTPGYTFNHSLRGESLPKHYHFYSTEKDVEAIPVPEPENMFALMVTGLMMIRLLRKNSN